jgi:hypothetical protein
MQVVGGGHRRVGSRVDAKALCTYQAINKTWGDASDTFALVDPNNHSSRNLFERNAFRMIVPAKGANGEADSLFRRIGGRVPWSDPRETGANTGARRSETA